MIGPLIIDSCTCATADPTHARLQGSQIRADEPSGDSTLRARYCGNDCALKNTCRAVHDAVAAVDGVAERPG